MLDARGLTVAHGQHVAVRDVDLDLRAGHVTALMGRNGSGKSTLIWTLQGAGDAPLRHRRGRRRRPGAARRRAGAGPWSGWCRRPPPTCSTSRPWPRSARPPTPAPGGGPAPAAPCSTGSCPGIDDDHHPRDLSEGQRLALVLAIVLTARPAGAAARRADPRPRLRRQAPAWPAIVRDLADDGHAVLIATHDVEFVATVADDVVVLAEGEVVSAGPDAEVVAASPSFAPQVTKILGPPWLRVDEVVGAGGAS